MRSFYEQWKNRRKKGRLAYSLQYGAIWGAINTVLFCVIMSLLEGERKLDYQRVISSLVVFIIAGIISSYFFTWKANEKEFFRQMDKKNESENS